MDVSMCIECKKVSTEPYDGSLFQRFYTIDMLPKSIRKDLERQENFGNFGTFSGKGLYVTYTICVKCGTPSAEELRSIILVKDVRTT